MIGVNGNRWTAAVVAGVLLSISLVSPTAATPPTPASGTVWETAQLKYRWLSGSEPPTWMRNAIHAAAQDASVSTMADTPSFGYDGSGTGWFAYTGDIPTDYAVGYAVRNVPTSFGIRLRPQGYSLDWGTLRWCQFYDSPPSGCFDAELITLHEIGHVLTLGHIDESTVTDWTDTIMHAAPKTKAKTGWNAHDFGRCDAARLQLRYGRGVAQRAHQQLPRSRYGSRAVGKPGHVHRLRLERDPFGKPAHRRRFAGGHPCRRPAFRPVRLVAAAPGGRRDLDGPYPDDRLD